MRVNKIVIEQWERKGSFSSSKQTLMNKDSTIGFIKLLTEPTVANHAINNFNHCIYKHFRGYFILGKILGVIPLQGLFTAKSLENVRFRYGSLESLISMLICLLLSTCAIVGGIGMLKSGKTNNVTEISNSASQFAFFLYGCFVYFHFLRNSNYLIGMFYTWRKAELYFTKEDTKLHKHVLFIAGIAFASAAVDNTCYFVKKFQPFSDQNKSVLEYYYTHDYKFWADMINYNPILSAILFFANKACWFSSNYADIFIALMGRALYFRFKTLTEVATLEWVSLKQAKNKSAEKLFWKHLVQDHGTLCKILDSFADFLSPIIFASYSINIYTLCRRINGILTGTVSHGGTAIDTFYSVWSFVQMTGRTFFITLTGANVNDFAHGIRKLFLKCPSDCYTIEVKRGEYSVTSMYQIGLHGLNCFLIKKSFFLSLVSVIFTVLIVFLNTTNLKNE